MAAIWVFDVDGCLIDSLTGTSLRPGSAELLSQLQADGHAVLLWSAGGIDYAQQRASEHGIAEHFDGFHSKDERDAEGRYRPDAFLTGLSGVVFVDDRPEDMPVGADVIAVSPYLSDNRHDRGLTPVIERAMHLSASCPPAAARRSAPRARPVRSENTSRG